jgi:hypothetical protein
LQNSHEIFHLRKFLEDVDLYHLLKAQNLKEDRMWHPIAQCFWNLDLQMNPQETNAAITLKSRFVRFAFMNSREALEKVLDMIVYWGAYGHKKHTSAWEKIARGLIIRACKSQFTQSKKPGYLSKWLHLESSNYRLRDSLF